MGARTAGDIGLRAGDCGLAVHVDLDKTAPCFSVDRTFLLMYETSVYQALPLPVQEKMGQMAYLYIPLRP